MRPAAAYSSLPCSPLHLEKSPGSLRPPRTLRLPTAALCTPDFASHPPAVLTDLPETSHMLFPLPGRSPTGPRLCPVSFCSTSGSELRHHFLKAEVHPV